MYCTVGHSRTAFESSTIRYWNGDVLKHVGLIWTLQKLQLNDITHENAATFKSLHFINLSVCVCVCACTVWLRKQQRKDGWFQNHSWNVCSGKLYLYYGQRPETGTDAYRPVICNCDHSNYPLALSVYHSVTSLSFEVCPSNLLL
jgi:hypothetical protein